MKKRVLVRENEQVESLWPNTVCGTLVIVKAPSGWYRCLIIDPPNSQTGFDGDGQTAVEAYRIAIEQWRQNEYDTNVRLKTRKNQWF